MENECGIIELKANATGILGQSRIDGYWMISNKFASNANLYKYRGIIDPSGRWCTLEYFNYEGFKLKPIPKEQEITLNKKLLLVNF